MLKPIARTYLSLAAFYAADPLRRDSRERDVGLWWRSVHGPTYRAAWVEATGELYLFQHALTGPGSGSVHLLAATMNADEIESKLEGWQDECGRPGSLEWLLTRAAPRARRRVNVNRYPTTSGNRWAASGIGSVGLRAVPSH